MVVAVGECTIWHFYVHVAVEKGDKSRNNLPLKVFLLIIVTYMFSFVYAIITCVDKAIVKVAPDLYEKGDYFPQIG